jgi:hypothetical protein
MTGAKKSAVIGASTFQNLDALPPRSAPRRDAVASAQESPAPNSTCESWRLVPRFCIRHAVSAEQENPATYSRMFRAGPTFALLRANISAFGCASSMNLAGSPSGFPALLGKFLGHCVGALWLRIFNVNPSSTIRLAAPMVTNSELAA